MLDVSVCGGCLIRTHVGKMYTKTSFTISKLLVLGSQLKGTVSIVPSSQG